ncbi:MAG: hypothetical protein ACR2N8_04990, partial [Parvibaculales bacterium]
KDKHSIIIDIETDEFVIEAGLDKRSSLDSIQQALYAAHLTGKKPLIIIYNTDNKIGIYEHRIQQAAQSKQIPVFIYNVQK